MSDVLNAAPGRAAARGWAAVAAVTLGIFSLMTSELLPVGLLTPIGTGLGVSEGVAGLMMTVPGLVAALSAPLLTVVGGRIDRRVMLIALIGLMSAANLAGAVGSSFAVVLAARIAVGVSVGGFWAIAGGLALRLVPEAHVARATAVIFGGVSTASVVGVPAGTLAGELGGWRVAFGAVGVLGLVALAGLVLLLPALPSRQTITFVELPRVLRAPAVRTGVILTLLLITGHFAAYTFVRPILQTVAGVDPDLISLLLLGYGVAGIAGNFLAGARAARHPRGTLLTITLALTAATALMAAYGGTPAKGIVLLVVWGLAYGGVSVSLQTWMLKAAPQATEAATSLFVATFNLSIALGALLGGLVVDGLGTVGALWLAAALLLSAFAITTRTR
ncbi:MFS transporter [Nonomuraea mangrovi]|uniref:MFS transporter n=1 Tax=Nonomuraea mangrovi TaxID=2316207 RepID=A0ABW4SYJ6_9ACTN